LEEIVRDNNIYNKYYKARSLDGGCEQYIVTNDKNMLRIANDNLEKAEQELKRRIKMRLLAEIS
jgi:hypothetical protein